MDLEVQQAAVSVTSPSTVSPFDLEGCLLFKKTLCCSVPAVPGYPMVSSLNFDFLWLPEMVSFFCEMKFL